VFLKYKNKQALSIAWRFEWDTCRVLGQMWLWSMLIEDLVICMVEGIQLKNSLRVTSKDQLQELYKL
jgi:hypothetical protein